jgi:hypothetical protein
LAARAYADATPNGGVIEQVLDLIVRAMPGMIQRRRGQIWIPNPVNDEENFADRFVGHPEREQALYRWFRDITTDLDALRGTRGLDQVANAADSILGKGSGQRIARGSRRTFRKPAPRDGWRRCRPERSRSEEPPVTATTRSMAQPSGRHSRGLSLAVQAAHLERRYPDGRIALRPSRLTWLRQLRPTEISHLYEVLVVIEPGWAPLVYVVDPPLQRRGEEPVPHLYSANDLCLYVADEWDDTMIIADTLIPWTSEWLFFYQTWHATGDWLSGGVHPDRGHPRQHRRDLQHNRKGRRSVRLHAGIQQAYGRSADIEKLTQSSRTRPLVPGVDADVETTRAGHGVIGAR